MDRFRKKPVVIEAVQWTGENTAEVEAFLGDDTLGAVDHFTDGPYMPIRTLDSVARLFPGDWALRGTEGEHYPCKPDVFAATYEPETA